MANGETAVYTPPEWAQIKTCAVDFDSRALAAPVHLVQYDRTMPVLEVALYRKGEPYAVPAGADINIRMDKKDGHHIYSPALGLSADRTKAYIAVTPQMTTTAGTLYPIIEVMANGGVASTSPLRLQFDPNPVPEDAITSSDEYKTLEQLVADVNASAQAAAKSAAAAKNSEDAAAKSAAAADNTANSIKDSMAQISENKEAVSRLKEDTTALQKRQNVLVGSETGNPVSCDDAFAAPMCGLHIYGKSTQNGTPTPDAPVPIVSAGDGGTIVVALSNGNDKTQTLTLPTPNGLPGIPVTSGGNYTDPTGQQWVCDEVDLERGVKVQRVKRVDISSLDKSYWDFRGDTGTDTSSTRYKNGAVMIDFKSNAPTMNNILPVGVANIKNTFRLVATPLYLYQFNLDASEFPTVKSWTEYLEANTVLVIYATVTPIETPLADAEIAAYKALTAYAPDTVVQASDGAGIKLCYQRDVNLVVKNLEDAIASMTTT